MSCISGHVKPRSWRANESHIYRLSFRSAGPAALSAAGAIYKCTGANGEITYTNVNCPDKTAVQNYDKGASSGRIDANGGAPCTALTVSTTCERDTTGRLKDENGRCVEDICGKCQ